MGLAVAIGTATTRNNNNHDKSVWRQNFIGLVSILANSNLVELCDSVPSVNNYSTFLTGDDFGLCEGILGSILNNRICHICYYPSHHGF